MLMQVLAMIMKGRALKIVAANRSSGCDAWFQILDRYSKTMTPPEALVMLQKMALFDLRKDLAQRASELLEQLGGGAAATGFFVTAFRNAVDPNASPPNAPPIFGHFDHDLGQFGPDASADAVIAAYKKL